MTFSDWIDTQIPRRGETRYAVCVYLHERLEQAGTPISLSGITSFARGAKLRNYQKAKAISDATRGVVTVAELCE